MEEYILQILTNNTTKDLYTVVITFVCLFFVFRSMYNKIKFECLEKATQKIAAVEELSELSGEEKFALVLCWINSDLPKIFNNSAVRNIVEKLIDTAYNGAYRYSRNYIKRKTGKDLDEIMNMIDDANKEIKNDASTEQK